MPGEDAEDAEEGRALVLCRTRAGELILVLCVAGGVPIAPAVRLATEPAMLTLAVAAAVLIVLDHRRSRRAGLGHRAASAAAIADTVQAPVRKLTAHEVFLSTSFLRWVAAVARTWSAPTSRCACATEPCWTSV
ncbi:hypothetical protein ACFYWU_17520 [Streptomyces chrestomyceticus]|uniref:hypothetical protein n=1 Tax=Streptomyces chrestomyceticus TaxID=68185 RepID=UPI0036BD079E